MLPEEVTRFIGKAGDISIMEVDKGAIRRYAAAIEDGNPLYWDEDHARNSRYGSIIAPPAFFGWPTQKTKGASVPSGEVLVDAMAKAGYTNPGTINAGEEYEFFRPVRAGDILASSTVVKDIRERAGRNGNMMVFIVRETTYVNQNGDVVAKAQVITIRR